jgi:UDP-glucose 4-epimerase
MKVPNSVFVTGGAGFVGSWLVRELLERTAAQIFVYDNFRNGKREFLPDDARIEVVEADIRDSGELNRAVGLAKPDWVFHLAALHFIPYCNSHPEETMDVNVVGTQSLLEACRRTRPDVCVVASSAAVYPIREVANCEEDPTGPTDIYGLTKCVNESQLQLFSRQVPSVRCASARFANVYGPHETNPHVIPEIVEQMVEGRSNLLLGNVKPLRDYVFVTDVATALVAIASRSESAYRAYNVSTNSEFSVEDVVAELAQTSGIRLRILTDPARVRPSDRMHLLCDNSRLIRETGWSPRFDLRSGLQELWSWTKQQAPALITP